MTDDFKTKLDETIATLAARRAAEDAFTEGWRKTRKEVVVPALTIASEKLVAKMKIGVDTFHANDDDPACLKFMSDDKPPFTQMARLCFVPDTEGRIVVVKWDERESARQHEPTEKVVERVGLQDLTQSKVEALVLDFVDHVSAPKG
jgi:hypothetical protein